MATLLHNSRARAHLRPARIQFATVKDMLARFRPDEFTLAMAATVAIALAAPCYGAGASFSKL
jgi:hypothetical protein